MILFVTALSALSCSAQCNITGKIVDTTNTSVPFATVGLMNIHDSSFIKGVLTGGDGSYTLEKVNSGTYLLKVFATGFTDVYRSIVVTDTSKIIPLPAIQLKAKTNSLKVVDIVADKPFVEQKPDRTVYNIGSNDLSAGKNLAEILHDLPGLIVDENTGISVAGKSGVIILINNMPIYMNDLDALQYLKSIDASSIEKIEVITNPSVKYDAGGGAVINIVLKKGKGLGFNGNISTTYTQSYYGYGNGTANGTYRASKWTIFGYAGISSSHNIRTSDITRDFDSPTEPSLFEESIIYTGKGYSPSGNLSVHYTPGDNQDIGFSVNGGYNSSSSYNLHNTNMYTGSTPDSSNTAIGNSTWLSNYFSCNLTYQYKIDSTGQEFSASLNYSPHFYTSSQQNILDYYNGDGGFLRAPSDYTYDNPNNTNTYAGQADYTQPFGKDDKLEMGIKGTFSDNDNNNEYWNILQNAEEPDTIRSNNFNFSEDIYAAYIRYTKKLSRRWNAALGLRGENTQDKGIQYVHDTSFTRNYYNLFPNGLLSWKADTNNTFTVTYRENLYRPGSGNLNPFMQYITPYSYSVGNVNIMPQVAHTYNLSYSFKTLFTFSLQYTHTSDVIYWLWEENYTTLISYHTPVNIASSDVYYSSLSNYLHVTKWWTMINYVDLNTSIYNGTVDGASISNNGITWSVSTNNTFTAKHGWRAEFYFNYRSESVNGYSIQQPYYTMNAGISKRFAEERGTIKLGSRNILAPYYYSSTQTLLNATVYYQSHSYLNETYLTLTWKLENSKKKKEEQMEKILGQLKT